VTRPTDFLAGLLQPETLTRVVDIGANLVDGEPPYHSMLKNGLCQLTGFEPQAEPLAELNRLKGPLETYLPYCVGDGEQHTLYQCAASGLTSLFRPDPQYLDLFNDFGEMGEVLATSSVVTRRLDEIAEIDSIDLLKIDIQGGELAVFENGREKLRNTVAIQTEVSFMPLYQGQPMFADIDRELRSQGFIPHAFEAIKKWPIAPYAHPDNFRQEINQLLEADVIYVKDFVNMDQLSDEQLKHMAMIAHHCYGSHDLVTRCLSALDERGKIDSSAIARYRRHIFPDHTFFGDIKPTNLPFKLDL
jgi:FkbM family methyltransferase